MRIMRFALVAVACCFVLLGSAWAQVPRCTQGVIPVGVLEGELNYMGMLGREHFRVELSHQQLEVENATPSVPSNVILLLDSGPMTRTSVQKRRYQLQLAYYLISAVPEKSAVTMVVYGKQTDALLQDRKSILKELQARLEGNDPKSGDSALVPNALKVIANMSAPQPGDVIFVLTSGDFSPSSKHSQEELIGAFQQRGVRLFYVFLDDILRRIGRMGSTADVRYGRDILLGNMPQQTGGTSLRIPAWMGPGAASAFKDPLVSMMYRFYRLEFKLPQSVSAAEPVSVILTDAAKKLGTKPVVLYPARMQPCGEKAAK
jgi:hypothetical protein